MNRNNQLFSVALEDANKTYEMELILPFIPDDMTSIRLLQEVAEHIIRHDLLPSPTARIVKVNWVGDISNYNFEPNIQANLNNKLDKFLGSNREIDIPLGWMSSEMTG